MLKTFSDLETLPHINAQHISYQNQRFISNGIPKRAWKSVGPREYLLLSSIRESVCAKIVAERWESTYTNVQHHSR